MGPMKSTHELITSTKVFHMYWPTGDGDGTIVKSAMGYW